MRTKILVEIVLHAVLFALFTILLGLAIQRFDGSPFAAAQVLLWIVGGVHSAQRVENRWEAFWSVGR